MAFIPTMPTVACWGYGRSRNVLGVLMATPHALLYPNNEQWQVLTAAGVYDEEATIKKLQDHVSGTSNSLGLPCSYVTAMPALSIAQLSVAVGSYGLRVGGNGLLRQMYPGYQPAYGEDTF